MWPFDRKLNDVLYETKTVRLHGVKFILRKIDTTDHMDGSKVMLQMYDTYKIPGRTSDEMSKSLGKIKDHFRDVFMASVIEPKLSRKPSTEGSIFVDHLFTEWDLAQGLYGSIIEFTYGKKKLKPDILAARSS